jgi:hypothetical protein
MFEKSTNYKNTDVLLMDPGFSRMYDGDIDSELYCSDMVADLSGDGCYHVIRGRLEDMEDRLDEISDNPKPYSLGRIAVESARIGVYDYHEAVEEMPELKGRMERGEILATVIRNFTGTIRTMKDEDCEVYVVGKSDDGKLEFFTIAFYDW